MARRLEQAIFTAGQRRVDIFADLDWSDDVVAALEHQRADRFGERRAGPYTSTTIAASSAEIAAPTQASAELPPVMVKRSGQVL